MPKTANDLVEESRRYLIGSTREERNQLSAAIVSTSATSISFTHDLGGIQRGAVIAVDLELMYVWSVSALTATVSRGVLGSTAATHLVDSIVHVNPRFSTFSIFQQINNELDDLSSPVNGLYQMLFIDLSYSAAVEGYNLTSISSQFLDVYELRYKLPDSSSNWPEIKSYDVARKMDTATFASGSAIFLHEGGFPGNPIRVRYKAPFTTLSALADVASTVSGLHESALDILSLGAAMRLVAADEISRSSAQSQGDTRRADEVPPQAIAQSMLALQALRKARVTAEAARLNKQFPLRRPIP